MLQVRTAPASVSFWAPLWLEHHVPVALLHAKPATAVPTPLLLLAALRRGANAHRTGGVNGRGGTLAVHWQCLARSWPGTEREQRGEQARRSNSGPPAWSTQLDAHAYVCHGRFRNRVRLVRWPGGV